tara:strand:- start:679 stop:927 length:249 start_codon:yes stop_codon:yes gene_type:complete
MDIIAVNHSRLKASLDEAVFDINAALEQPLEEGSNRRFATAVQKYTQAATQLETLVRLQQEMDKSSSEPEEANETEGEQSEG